MGIEPTFPGYIPGVLSQLNYGLIRQTAQISLRNLRTRSCAGSTSCVRNGKVDGQVVPQDEDLQSGIRTRPRLSSGRSLMASDLPLAWRITCNFRPIEIGVTNRIRTGTNAFTGRDAAVTS